MAYLSLWIPLYLFIGAATLLFVWLRKRFNYWAERGVVHDKPSLLYGNFEGVGKTKALRDPFKNLYDKYKQTAPFGGFYFSFRISAVIFDLDLVKNVLVKDFANFTNRGQYHNAKDDPVSGNLFNLDGSSWRHMRTKLTPTFTSSKMKFMFPTIVAVANEFVKVLRRESEQSKGEGLEIRDILARFTTDVIGSCAFGLDCNSLQDPDTKFRIMGKKIFTSRRYGKFVMAFVQTYPQLARKLGIRMTHDDVSKFFLKVVYDTVAYREESGEQRSDFMNLLLELKNQENGLSMNEIAAQAFVFFVAGFETSSSTMAFSMYELALHQEIQERAREEIETVLARFDDQFTYECLREIKYLDQIFCETLRKYSIAAFVTRQALNDYKVPNTDYVIEKDVSIFIPVDAIHRDAEIYPDPERFDPTRFEPAEIAKRHPMAWLPFGEGPRNCIGLRFGKMQAMVGLALLIKNFKFTLTSKMQVPLEISKKSFVLTSKDGIHLHMEWLGSEK